MEPDDDIKSNWHKRPIKNKNKIKHMLYLQLPKSTLYFLFWAFFAWLVVLYGLTYEKPLESGKESQITLFKEQLKQENDPKTDGSAHKLSENDISDVIKTISIEKGYNNPEYAIALTYCESRHNPNATGINKNGTKDRGLWQINDYWHPEVQDTCAYDAKCSTEWAIDMLKNGQAHQWTCSKII